LAIIFAACLAPRYDGNVHARTDTPQREASVPCYQSDNATAEPDSPERVSDAPVPESTGGQEEIVCHQQMQLIIHNYSC
jgi:hypothetical protein